MSSGSSHEKIRSTYYVIGIGAFLSAAIWAVFNFYIKEHDKHINYYGNLYINIILTQVKLPQDKNLYLRTDIELSNNGEQSINLQLPEVFLSIYKVNFRGHHPHNSEQNKIINKPLPSGAHELFIRRRHKEIYP